LHMKVLFEFHYGQFLHLNNQLQTTPLIELLGNFLRIVDEIGKRKRNKWDCGS